MRKNDKVEIQTPAQLSVFTFAKLFTAESVHPNAKYSVKESQEHYSTICTDDMLPYWNYHIEPLCTVVGRVPFLAHPHLSLFCSLQLRVTQQPITVQLNTDDDCLSDSEQLHVSCPGSFFHSFSIGSSREA